MIKKYTFRVLSLVMITHLINNCLLFAQNPALSVSQFYDNATGIETVVAAVKSDDNTKVFITGTTEVSGNIDVFTAAFSADGSELWRHTFGSINVEAPKDIVYHDGNVYVMGNYNKLSVSDLHDEYFIGKFSDTSGFIDTAIFTHGNDIDLIDMAVNSAGDVFLTGSSIHQLSYTDSDIFTKAVSGNDLSSLFEYVIGGYFAGVGRKILIDSQDDVYVWGTVLISSFSDKDCILVKLGPDLSYISEQTFQGYAGKNDRAVDAELSSTGLYVYALAEGGDNTVNADPHFALYKINASTLARLWLKRKGHNIVGAYYPKDIHLGSNNYIYVTGQGATTNDIYTAAYRQTGGLSWEVTRSFGFDEYGSALCYENGDIYVATYSSDNSIKVIRYEGTTGAVVWPSEYISYVGTSALSDATDIFSLSTSEICIVASDENAAAVPSQDYLLLKYSDTAPRNADEDNVQISVYPNPASSTTKIQFSQPFDMIQVFSAGGSIVYENRIDNVKEIDIDLTNYTTGIYYVKAFSGHVIATQTLAVIQ